jgi:hypothetical protein
MPITRQDWVGKIGGKTEVVLRKITHGASPTYTVDIPSRQVTDAPVTPSQHGEQVHLVVAIPGHPATIAGHMDAAHETLTGTFTQDDKSEPLTLKPLHPAH